MDPYEYAIEQIEAEGGPARCVQPFHPMDDQLGPYKGRGNDNAWGARYSETLNRIMKADLSVISTEYDRAVTGYYPGGKELVSTDGVDEFWIGLRSSFPSANFEIHHQIGREDPIMLSPRAAVRWSVTGKTRWLGCMFGQPTGAEVSRDGLQPR